MKKIIIMGLVIIMSVTGCTAKGDVSLEDYYGELINKSFKDISMDEVKKSLKGFDYEYELHEYLKEDTSEYEGDIELNDSSDNKFKDENGNFIDVTFDETNKKVSGIGYSKEEKDTTRNIICGKSFSMAILYGSNIEKQKNIIDNLKLYKNLTQIVEPYFEVVSNLRDGKEMTVDDVKSILKIDYKEINDEYYRENTSGYEFVQEDAKGIEIKVETKDKKIKDADLYIDSAEGSNYRLILRATNESILDKESPFNLETSIMLNISEEFIDESGHAKEGALTKKNVELFNFIFKRKNINFYSEKYNEESEKNTPLLEIKLDEVDDEDEDMYRIYFMDEKVITEDRDYIKDTPIKLNLEKGEYLKVEIEMKSNEKLSIPIVITLQDLSNGEYIYSKSVDNTNENVFTTEKVDKDGEYEISVGMSDLKKYKYKVLAVKE